MTRRGSGVIGWLRFAPHVMPPRRERGRRQHPRAGRGRELGYVAISRARQATRVHAVADSIGKAVDDLAWDWSCERRQTWAIVVGTPIQGQQHALEIEIDKEKHSRSERPSGGLASEQKETTLAATGRPAPNRKPGAPSPDSRDSTAASTPTTSDSNPVAAIRPHSA
jgi:hypothetical protein